MILRTLGLNAQELETGPLVFLLSHSIPVAYKDKSSGAMPPGLYRTDRFFSKAVSRHLNKWLGDRPHSTVPHDIIVAAFRQVSRFHDQPADAWTVPY